MAQYIYNFELYGDFDMTYTYALLLSDKNYNIKTIKEEFKKFFNITKIDNSIETAEKFISYCKKYYSFDVITNSELNDFTISEE